MAIERRYSTSAKGGDKDFKTQDARGLREERGIVVGIVKTNAHPSAMGVLQVFVPNFADESRENDKSQWRSVKYATPFYSRTDALGPGDSGTMVKNTGGIVYPCPDIGTKVLCFFPEGRNQDGFWFACAPDVYMMQTIPEAGMTNNFDKTGLEKLVRHDKAPGIEFNDILNDVKKLTNFKKVKRGVDFDKAIQLKSQGLDKDEIRGLTSSNAMRETPSELFGISTKGRKTDIKSKDIANRSDILEKLNSGEDLSNIDARAVEGKIARKHGHAFVMDDGDIEGNNNLVRLRSAGGHQILLHDTENVIYIGNSTGTTWLQMDAQGQLDVYSKTNINFRSKSMNFHADSSIKFHAGKQIQMVSGGSLTLEGKSLANLYSDGQAMVYGGKGAHIKSGATLQMQGGSTVGIKAGGNMDLSASCIALNGSAGGASKQNSVPVKNKDDTKPNPNGFYVKDKGAISTTVDRVPTHEPFDLHKKVTQETIFKTVDVTDVPTSGKLAVKKPKQPINVVDQGLTEMQKFGSTVSAKTTAYQELIEQTFNYGSAISAEAVQQEQELLVDESYVYE